MTSITNHNFSRCSFSSTPPQTHPYIATQPYVSPSDTFALEPVQNMCVEATQAYVSPSNSNSNHPDPNLFGIEKTLILTQKDVHSPENFLTCEFRINEISQLCSPFNSSMSIFERIHVLQNTLKDPERYVHIAMSQNNPEILITADCAYIILRKLGAGMQSAVYLARKVSRNFSPPAEKVIKSSHSSFSPQYKLLNNSCITDDRIDLIKAIYRPTTMFSSYQHLAIVDKSDIDLKRFNFSTKTSPVKFIIPKLWELACGIAALHEKNIIHRDIKPDNLLINEYQMSKVTDTGLAKKAPEGIKDGHTACTVFYAAPFIWSDLYDQKRRLGHQGKEADVFAYGRTIQYGVVIRNLLDLAKKHNVDFDSLHNSMKPKTHLLLGQDDPISAYEELKSLPSLYPDNIIIIFFIPRTADSAGNAEALIFPNHDRLLELTLEAFHLFKDHASHEELSLLEKLAYLAHELQQPIPEHLPTIQDVVKKLEVLTETVRQSNRLSPAPINTKVSAPNKMADDFTFALKYQLKKPQETPFKPSNKANLRQPMVPKTVSRISGIENIAPKMNLLKKYDDQNIVFDGLS